ncbi:MAG: glutathione S-transferase family protein [Rhizobiaceae bacterium]|nr:glutathione S-transferase family protein [Rhizobiaceae bacterium]
MRIPAVNVSFEGAKRSSDGNTAIGGYEPFHGIAREYEHTYSCEWFSLISRFSMTLKIYGNMRSSAFRVVWAAEELGLSYELHEIEVEDCASDKELAVLNPNRKIPVIEDGDVVLWESMAINLYLARKSGGELAPKDEIEDAQMQMWSFWVSNECVSDCMTVLAHSVLIPEDERSTEALEAALRRLGRPLEVLNEHLVTTGFVINARFTIADLNIASVFGWLVAASIDLAAYPSILAWFKRCSDRSAAKKCSAMAAGV